MVQKIVANNQWNQKWSQKIAQKKCSKKVFKKEKIKNIAVKLNSINNTKIQLKASLINK